jgi:hypothetical protein
MIYVGYDTLLFHGRCLWNPRLRYYTRDELRLYFFASIEEACVYEFNTFSAFFTLRVLKDKRGLEPAATENQSFMV